MTESKYKDDVCIPKWRSLVGRFNKLVESDPKPESIMRELVALKEEATHSGAMTPPQVSGIIARCDNYINGNYGRKAAQTA